MAKVDLVGVGIVKTYPTTTGGPGGHPSPPGPGRKTTGCGWPNSTETVRITIYSRPWKICPPNSSFLETPPKKQNFSEIDQNEKKHENRQNDVIFTG